MSPSEIGRIKGLFAHKNVHEPGSVLAIVTDNDPTLSDDCTFSPTIQASQEIQNHIREVIYPIVFDCAKELGQPEPRFRISIQNPDGAALNNQQAKVTGLSEGLAVLLSMLSTVLRIPIRQDLAVTAAITDMTGTCGLISLEGKLEAAERAQIPMVLACTGLAVEIPTNEAEIIGNNNKVLINQHLRTVKTKPIDHLATALPYVFDRKDTLHYLITHNHIGPKADPLPDDPRPRATGLVEYLRRTTDELWVEVESLVKRNSLCEASNLLKAFVEQSLHIQRDFPTGIGKAFAHLRATNPTAKAYGATSGILPLPVWDALADAANPTNAASYWDILQISYEWEITQLDILEHFRKISFRNRMRSLILTALKSGNISLVTVTLSALNQKFSQDQIDMTIYLEDVRVFLNAHFFNQLIPLAEEAIESAKVRIQQYESRLVQDPYKFYGIHEDFQELLHRVYAAADIIRSVYEIDPVMGLDLYRTGNFGALHQVLENVILQHSEIRPDYRSFVCAMVRHLLDHQSLHDLAAVINRTSFAEGEISLRQSDPPRFRLRVDKDLSKITIRCSDSEAGIEGSPNVISDPPLLFPLSYDLPQYWQPRSWAIDKCEVLSLPGGGLDSYKSGDPDWSSKSKILGSLRGGRDVGITYINTELIWNTTFSKSPTINDLFILDCLQKNGYYDDSSITSILDCRSGHGLLGIHFARENSHVRWITFTSYSIRNRLLINQNIWANLEGRLKRDLQCHVKVAKDFGIDHGKVFDLILCSPPICLDNTYLNPADKYIDLDFVDRGLLRAVVVGSLERGEELVLSVCSPQQHEFDRLVSALGARTRLLGERMSPFCPMCARPLTPEERLGKNWRFHPQRGDAERRWLLHRAYTDRLVDAGLVEIRDDDTSRNFRYWQKIRAYSVRYK